MPCTFFAYRSHWLYLIVRSHFLPIFSRFAATWMLAMGLVLLASPNALFAQASATDSLFSAEAYVVDFATRKPMAYVKVYNASNRTGTVSNLNGFFRLPLLQGTDSIAFSFVGYEKLKISGTALAVMDTVFLIPKSEMLQEVVVYSDDVFLYDLLAACAKGAERQPRMAKTYFALESYVNNHQVELVECYYNGTFAGYDVKSLALKQGRFALAPFGNRLFISTETSRALNLHRMFESSAYFPESPTAVKRKQVQRLFGLKLRKKFKEDTGAVIYVIDYTPRQQTEACFSGTLWIDSASATIQRIRYEIEDAAVHPFALIARSDGLLRADLAMTKSFQQVDGKMYVTAIDFSYRLDYKYRENDSIQTIRSNAILYAYDYGDTFHLPRFQYTEGMYGDYVKILASPYNDFFWRNMDEFKVNAQQQKNDQFFAVNGNNTEQARHKNRADSSGWNFEKPYITWSEKRVLFKEDLPDPATQKAGAVPAELYNLCVQVYLDANFLNDSLSLFSATIFDPYETFYYLPMDRAATTFINVYFDLMEIQRRNMIALMLQEAATESEVDHIYALKMQEARILSEIYFREVDRGTNKEALLKWNELVKTELRIDNVALFHPYEEE